MTKKKFIFNLTLLFCMLGVAACCQSCGGEDNEPNTGKVKAEIAGNYVIRAFFKYNND